MFRIITCLIFTNKISRVSAHSESDLEASELIGSFFFAFNEFWISPCFKKNLKKPAKTQRKTNQTATNKSKLQQRSSYVHTIKASAPLALFLYEKPPRVSSYQQHIWPKHQLTCHRTPTWNSFNNYFLTSEEHWGQPKDTALLCLQCCVRGSKCVNWVETH